MQPDKRRVRAVREAIDSWPTFVLHISRRLTGAADSFRVGEDVRGVKLLRTGIDDLTEFLSWVGEIRGVVEEAGTHVDGADELRETLTAAAEDIRRAIRRGDLSDAADLIESRLVQGLMGTGALADRLCEDLSRMQGAA
jgi:hypothetical protein